MLDILYYIIIYPIYLIIEILFSVFYYQQIGIGLTIFIVSLFVNIASLPMYVSAYKLQQKEREIQNKMADKVKSIKRNFKGSERYMMLSAYYRQNNYHPVMALRSSLSLLIQIPFFTAAYLFFSNLPILKIETFWFIKSLAQPDALITIKGFNINILPILMTIFNIASGEIYMKGFKFKEKFQMYGLAIVFLVILYNSPSGLVLYWTFNNLISLIRSFILKLKNKKNIFYILILTLILIFFINLPEYMIPNVFNFLFKFFVFFIIPVIIYVKYLNKIKPQNNKKENLIFILSCCSACVLVGLLIPSNLLYSSPLDFSISPIKLFFYPVIQSIGIFCFWLPVFYFFVNTKIKRLILFIMLNFVFLTILNILTLSNIGILNEGFQLQENIADIFSFKSQIINLLFCLVITVSVSLLILKNKIDIILKLVCVILISTILLVIFNIYSIFFEYNKYVKNVLKPSDILTPIIHLSKDKKNVVIFMMDRMINSYLPIIFEEKPELKQIYTGFTYYPNTVSYYGYTILGLPPILGGYEYIPENLEKRPEKVVDKRNEAMFMLPTLLKNNNWNILMLDADWIDFKEIPDGKSFDKYNIDYDYIIGRYSVIYKKEFNIQKHVSCSQKRNFLIYAFFIASPYIFKDSIYDRGQYHSVKIGDEFNTGLINNYSSLYYMPKITDFNSEKSSFVFVDNKLTHCPANLQPPDYEPVNINVTSINKFDNDIFSSYNYNVNMAAFLLIGNFLNFLKENNVYDNTKIIIVSDHGFVISNPNFSDFLNKNLMYFNPILFVKDFNAKGEYKTDNTFMTNADVPLIATKDIIKNPINPFTNKILTDESKKKGTMICIDLDRFTPSSFSGTKVFEKNSKFNYVKDNVFDENNWILDYKYQSENKSSD